MRKQAAANPDAAGMNEVHRRSVLGHDRFKAVAEAMNDSPAGTDREAAWDALCDGALTLAVHRECSPDNMRDRKEAYDRVGRAITKLRKILVKGKHSEAIPDFMRGWSPTEELEREYEALGKQWLLWAGRPELLHEPPTKGRPPTPWQHKTRARLRKAGFSDTDAEELLEAAGLAVNPYPTERKPGARP